MVIKYKIMYELGSGDEGKAQLIKLSDGKLAVLKQFFKHSILRWNKATDDVLPHYNEDKQLLLQRIQIMQKHKNDFANIYWYDLKSLTIVMEYLPNPAYNDSEVASIASKYAKYLTDICNSNCGADKDGNIKVFDFVVSKNKRLPKISLTKRKNLL